MSNRITEKDFTPEERAAVKRVCVGVMLSEHGKAPETIGELLVVEMRRAARDAAAAAREDEAKKHRPPPDYGYNGEGGPGSGGRW